MEFKLVFFTFLIVCDSFRDELVLDVLFIILLKCVEDARYSFFLFSTFIPNKPDSSCSGARVLVEYQN